MPLDLGGHATTEAIAETAKPETRIDVSAGVGGTVRAEIASEGAWWSASAWYEWGKQKGKDYGAKVGLKF